MKRISRRILKIILMLIVIVLALVITINFPVTNFKHSESDLDYSSWMTDNLTSEQKIIDIAMLGAHDAFTNDITLFSKIDLLSADSIQTGTIGMLIKGFSMRQSRTQVSDASELLANGVRYFDIRLSYNESKSAWYTSHTYYSRDFLEVLAEIETFLNDNPGEFLILDLQHIYGVDYTSQADFQEIYALFDDAGILEYAYLEGDKVLSDVTYGDVTNNKQQGGVIILSKFEEEDDSFWQYGSNIRSAWPNMDLDGEVFAFLDAESDLINAGNAMTGNQIPDNFYEQNSQNGFRVMQAVLTMQMSGEGILNALTSWSLLERAKGFNVALIQAENFTQWLEAMPIVMVDYSDTNKDGFLDEIMTKIIEYNTN